MDSARHVIEHMLNPRFLTSTASYDVASTIHQSLINGGGIDLNFPHHENQLAQSEAGPGTSRACCTTHLPSDCLWLRSGLRRLPRMSIFSVPTVWLGCNR